MTGCVKGETLQRVATPTAMLVGLPDQLAGRCTAVLAGTGIRVLRVGHVAAACERVPVAMPQIVVVLEDLAEAERELLEDRCVAVGAQLLPLPAEASAKAVSAELLPAASHAVLRSQS